MNIREIASVTFRLFVVCTLVALLVSGVNFITKDRIAEIELEKTTSALGSVFGEDAQYFDVETSFAGSVTGIYGVNKNGVLYGYGVLASPMGFKDRINMLVAFDENGVLAVRIISLSETKDIGDRIMKDEEFLSQFIGIRNAVSIGNEVDAISGATISSRAATSGVNDAINSLKLYIAELQSAGGEA